MKFSEFRKKVNVKFTVDNDRYVIARLKAVPRFSEGIFAVINDANEVTVIAKEGFEMQPISEEKFFKLVTFNVALPFELSGFLSHVSVLLAGKNIPVFAVSAYSTDHIFIREADLDNAVEVLEKDGIESSNTC